MLFSSIKIEDYPPALCRYLSIIKEEGLEISQPALDPRKSELHHPITARERGSRVHRFKFLHENYVMEHRNIYIIYKNASVELPIIRTSLGT